MRRKLKKMLHHNHRILHPDKTSMVFWHARILLSLTKKKKLCKNTDRQVGNNVHFQFSPFVKNALK